MGNRIDVRTAAAGRWRSILMTLGMDEKALSGKHGPCPLCGGRDRFRFDDRDGRGTYFCSGCGAGDGVRLAMGITGLSFKDAACEIERLAGVVQPVTGKPERTDEDKLAALRRVWRESKPISGVTKPPSTWPGEGCACTTCRKPSGCIPACGIRTPSTRASIPRCWRP